MIAITKQERFFHLLLNKAVLISHFVPSILIRTVFQSFSIYHHDMLSLLIPSRHFSNLFNHHIADAASDFLQCILIYQPESLFIKMFIQYSEHFPQMRLIALRHITDAGRLYLFVRINAALYLQFPLVCSIYI